MNQMYSTLYKNSIENAVFKNSWHIAFKSSNKACFSLLKAMGKYKVFIRYNFVSPQREICKHKMLFSINFCLVCISFALVFLYSYFFVWNNFVAWHLSQFNAIQFYRAHNPPARIAANINVEFDICCCCCCLCFCSSFRLFRFFNQSIEHSDVTIYGLCTRYAWKGFHFQTICFQFGWMWSGHLCIHTHTSKQPSIHTINVRMKVFLPLEKLSYCMHSSEIELNWSGWSEQCALHATHSTNILKLVHVERPFVLGLFCTQWMIWAEREWKFEWVISMIIKWSINCWVKSGQ